MALLPGGLHGDRGLEFVPDEKPFAVLTFEGPNPGMSRVKQMRGFLWVHDEVGDYTKIDDVLKAARDIIPETIQHFHEGVWLIEASWEGDSPDSFDDIRRTNVKNAAFLLTGSGL